MARPPAAWTFTIAGRKCTLARNGAGHSVGNIVELQVQEQRLAGGHGAYPIGALGGEELLADLDAADRIAERARQARSALQIRCVEGDEEPFFGVDGCHRCPSSRACQAGHVTWWWI